MKAKVKEILNVNPRTNPEGRQFYFHEMLMDNDEKIKLMKTKEDAFKVGDEINYESYEVNGNTRHKEIKPNNWSGGGKSTKSNASFALSYAKDLCMSGVIKPDQIIPSADKFLERLNNN